MLGDSRRSRIGQRPSSEAPGGIRAAPESDPHRISFWRLQADQLWEVPENGKLTKGRGNADPLKSEFIKFQVKGGFPEPVYEAFRRNPLLVREAAKAILNSHFPVSVHSEILDAVGLDMELPADRVRHPSFRSEVLEAYGHACAFF